MKYIPYRNDASILMTMKKVFLAKCAVNIRLNGRDVKTKSLYKQTTHNRCNKSKQQNQKARKG
jgi:hypothetical protein